MRVVALSTQHRMERKASESLRPDLGFGCSVMELSILTTWKEIRHEVTFSYLQDFFFQNCISI